MTTDDRYRPSVLTAAITGGDILPCQSDVIPAGVEGIVSEAVAAAEAGATVVHLHGRDNTGRPSAEPELLAAIAQGIRDRSDVLINFTTGGSPGMSQEERLASLEAASPDLGTLNLGTMTYEVFPDRDRWPETKYAWEQEVLEQSGEGVFVNTLNSLRRFARAFRELGVAPELEAYDTGHLNIARYLIDEGSLEPPVRLQLVIGVLGGADNSVESLMAMRDAALRILGADLESIGVAATGYPMEFRCAAVGFALGMDVRVGLEDNLRVRRDRRASGNADLVANAVHIADAVGRPIADRKQLAPYLESWKRYERD